MSHAEYLAAKPLLAHENTTAVQAIGAASAALDVAASALGQAGLSRMLRLVSDTDCFYLVGDENVVVAANTGVFLAAGEEVIGVLSEAATHIAVIQDSAGGNLSVSLASR